MSLLNCSLNVFSGWEAEGKKSDIREEEGLTNITCDFSNVGIMLTD